MSFSNPLAAAWHWYCSRRFYWRWLLSAVVLLLVSAAAFVVVRAVQYRATPWSAGQLLPESSDISLDAPELSQAIPQLQKTAAWKTVEKKILREPLLRDAINAPLRQWKRDMGNDILEIPTLDDLEDRRYHDRTGGVVTWEMFYLVAGRDLALAVDIPSETRADFCLVTKLGFREFLPLPFGWWFGGLGGIEKESIRGVSCLRVDAGGGEKVWLAEQGALLVVSSSRLMMERALERKRKPMVSKSPLRARLDFTRSPVMKRILREMAQDDHLHLLRGVDLSKVSAGNVELNLRGNDVLFQSFWEGLECRTTPPNSFLRRAPKETAGLLVTTTSADDLWKYVQQITEGVTDDDSVPMVNFRNGVDTLKHSPFEKQLLPQFGEGAVVLFGMEHSEVTGKKHPAAGILVPVQDPMAAFQAMDKILEEFRTFTEGKWVRTNHHGFPVAYLTKLEGFVPAEGALIHIGYAASDEALVISNNPIFLLKVLDVTAGKGRSLEEVRAAQDLLEPSAALTLYGEFTLLREMVESVIPIYAEKSTDTDEGRKRLGMELRKRGLPQLKIDQIFDGEMNKRIDAAAAEHQKTLRPLSHLDHFVLQLRPEEGAGAELRVTLRLK